MSPRVLVAGIGNILFGDDGFGPAVTRRLAALPLPDGVRVMECGIRGLDLVYAMLEEHDLVILVDAARRGEPPGTLSLIEPEVPAGGPVSLDTHGMDPVKLLRLARALGARPARTLLVACEPAPEEPGEEEFREGLSPAVAGAVEEAARMVASLAEGAGKPAEEEDDEPEAVHPDRAGAGGGDHRQPAPGHHPLPEDPLHVAAARAGGKA